MLKANKPVKTTLTGAINGDWPDGYDMAVNISGMLYFVDTRVETVPCSSVGTLTKSQWEFTRHFKAISSVKFPNFNNAKIINTHFNNALTQGAPVQVFDPEDSSWSDGVYLTYDNDNAKHVVRVTGWGPDSIHEFEDDHVRLKPAITKVDMSLFVDSPILMDFNGCNIVTEYLAGVAGVAGVSAHGFATKGSLPTTPYTSCRPRLDHWNSVIDLTEKPEWLKYYNFSLRLISAVDRGQYELGEGGQPGDWSIVTAIKLNSLKDNVEY